MRFASAVDMPSVPVSQTAENLVRTRAGNQLPLWDACLGVVVTLHESGVRYLGCPVILVSFISVPYMI